VLRAQEARLPRSVYAETKVNDQGAYKPTATAEQHEARSEQGTRTNDHSGNNHQADLNSRGDGHADVLNCCGSHHNGTDRGLRQDLQV